jgi:phosphoadenosine phosphosulfate reductase
MRDEAALTYRDDLLSSDTAAPPVPVRDLSDLAAALDGLATLEMLDTAIHRLFPGRICAVSSFGAESAVALALIAEVAPETPVLFLDTGKHFAETLAYRDALTARLGLRDVRNLAPDPDMLDAVDPKGDLWRTRPDECCMVRKVLPLESALDDRLHGFDAWINGRKRYHGALRARLPRVERAEGRIKLNPLADWTAEMVRDEFLARALPRHPLVARGYLSIGCAPCTQRSTAADDPRAGRWQGRTKTECGIHG